MQEPMPYSIIGQSPMFVALALLACFAGSVITLRMFGRVRRTENTIKHLWLMLAGLMGGVTIWATQFIATLPYKSSLTDTPEAMATVASLFVAMAASLAGFYISAQDKHSAKIELGGALIGMGLVASLYIGLSTLHFGGSVEWNWFLVTASIASAIGFGMVATNRMGRPVTRFCKYGGSISFTLAIATTLLAGIGAMTIVPGSVGPAPVKAISETFLATSVLFILVSLTAAVMASHVIDIKTTQEAAEKYDHLAMHDALTGLANRSQLEARLDGLVSRQADDTARVAVASFDLRRFREINDAHGNLAGDEVLKIVAERLGRLLGHEETAGRFAGDRFIALKHSFYTRRQAAKFCERLQKVFDVPVEWNGHKIELKAGIGVAIFPDDGETAGELIERSGHAMYRAKETDSKDAVFYDAALDEEYRGRSALAIDLRSAVKNGELELFYQRQNNTKTGDVVGFESLMRWNHSEQGMVSPGIFIPIAEETGLVNELGEWALWEACREAASWEKPLRVAVNVAPAQLEASLPNLVHEVLLATGLPSSRLELEITETGIITDQQQTLHIVRQLKNLGVKVAMDDYGTGYSSLSTLQNFPFDKIKIDREFVQAVDTNKQSEAIVHSTVILADSLGIPVLAEGVETEEQLAVLRNRGVNEIQGFYFGKPMPVAEAREITGIRSAEANADSKNSSRKSSPAKAKKPVAAKKVRRVA